MTTLQTSLKELFDKRGEHSPVSAPHRFIELVGGVIVEVTAFEPDAITYQSNYYYNAVENKLYRRIDNGGSAYWIPASSPR